MSGFGLGGLWITNEWLALAIFLAAAGTDLLDGYLARRWKQVTTIGTLLDPIADKLLISAALISLVQVRALPGWMAILIIGREFAVSGLRSIAAAEGYTIKASDLGQNQDVLSGGGRFPACCSACAIPNCGNPAILLMWGVDLLRGDLSSQLLRQVLAQDRRTCQEPPAARTAGPRAPAAARRAASQRIEHRKGRLGCRDNLEAARGELNRSRLAFSAQRSHRFAV